MATIRELLDQYINRNSEALDASTAIFHRNTPYSVKLSDTAHDFITTLAEETKNYCKEEGYEIHRISFLSSYDADLNLEEAHYSPTSCNIRLKSDIMLKLVERADGKYEAIVFSGGYIEVERDGEEDKISS